MLSDLNAGGFEKPSSSSKYGEKMSKTDSVSPKSSEFKVLLIYSNTPMDNLMPVSVSSLSGSLRANGFNNIKLFDTTYYPLDKFGPGGAERKGSLAVAEFSYKKVGIKFMETNIFED